ncbi:hypothetical protein [Bradyrhizobium nanningense]|uniref:hypothetical protein n=1 Tax=Bradyrhizobium nanningense TaxID=1325118 RepID=UPI001008796B|nr:hypothetical protein [Bradyrhizobium nanningense]
MAQEFSDILQASQDFKPTGCPDRAIPFRAIPMNRSELRSRPAEKLTTESSLAELLKPQRRQFADGQDCLSSEALWSWWLITIDRS